VDVPQKDGVGRLHLTFTVKSHLSLLPASHPAVMHAINAHAALVEEAESKARKEREDEERRRQEQTKWILHRQALTYHDHDDMAYTSIKALLFYPQSVGKYRLRARVQGYEPRHVTDFCRLFCRSCHTRTRMSNDYLGSDICSNCGSEDAIAEYRFWLLLRDATGSLRVQIVGEQARQFLPDVPPANLHISNASAQALTKKLTQLCAPGAWVDCCVFSYTTASPRSSFSSTNPYDHSFSLFSSSFGHEDTSFFSLASQDPLAATEEQEEEPEMPSSDSASSSSSSYPLIDLGAARSTPGQLRTTRKDQRKFRMFDTVMI